MVNRVDRVSAGPDGSWPMRSRPGLKRGGGEHQHDGAGGQDGDLVACCGGGADGQPGADREDQRRPFERQLGHVGNEPALPAPERDADGDRVDRDHREDDDVAGAAPEPALVSAQQPEQKGCSEDPEVLGGDIEPVVEAAAQRGVRRRRSRDRRIKNGNQASGECHADDRGASDREAVALIQFCGDHWLMTQPWGV